MQRQKYIDIKPEEGLSHGDMFQIKYDGIWARIEIEHRLASIYSRSEKHKKDFDVEWPGTAVLIGEFMYGSQRSQVPERQGKLFIFDACSINGIDLRNKPYIDRYREASVLVNYLPPRFQIVKCFQAQGLLNAWPLLQERNEEGVVVRSSKATYDEPLHRAKFETEKLVYAVDFHAGQGKHSHHLGAISVALTPHGTPLMRVGGGFSDAQRTEIWRNIDYYRGRRLEIVGKGEFESGALRHPNFLRWR